MGSQVMARIFTGDFSTGDFSQWFIVANRYYTGAARDYVDEQYPARIVLHDGDGGHLARFEVRAGDIPAFGGNERSEVFGKGGLTRVDAGQTAWYAFSIKFDDDFPEDHAALGWGIVAQWHDEVDSGTYSPVLQWGWTGSSDNGYWHLSQNLAAFGLGTTRLLRLPLDRGHWHDIKMKIRFSPDPAIGTVNVWHNGEPQVFGDGSTTFTGITMPEVDWVITQIGYYRDVAVTETGVLFHAGFRIADCEESL